MDRRYPPRLHAEGKNADTESAVSLRIDGDIVEWFKLQGTRL
jgi:uncharacterized protein (DUF4415 family)